MEASNVSYQPLLISCVPLTLLVYEEVQILYALLPLSTCPRCVRQYSLQHALPIHLSPHVPTLLLKHHWRATLSNCSSVRLTLEFFISLIFRSLQVVIRDVDCPQVLDTYGGESDKKAYQRHIDGGEGVSTNIPFEVQAHFLFQGAFVGNIGRVRLKDPEKHDDNSNFATGGTYFTYRAVHSLFCEASCPALYQAEEHDFDVCENPPRYRIT